MKVLMTAVAAFCLAAGCSAASSTQQPNADAAYPVDAAQCTKLSSQMPSAGEAATRIAWVVDISKDAYRTPTPPPALSRAIEAALAAGGIPTLDIYLVPSSTVGPDKSFPLDFPGDGEAIRKLKQSRAVRCAAGFAASSSASEGRSPILARLEVVAANHPDDLVITSNGLNNVGAVNVNRHGPSTDWAAELRGRSNSDLRRTTKVTFTGLGVTQSGLLPAAAVASLKLLYWTWCDAAKAASCDFDSAVNSVPDDFKVPTTKHPDPVSKAWWRETGPTCRTSRDLPAAALFEGDSPHLRRQASQIVTQLATVLKASPQLAAHLVGHSATAGSVQHRRELSRQRAQALRAALIDQGVAGRRITADGVGSTQQLVDDTDGEGNLIESRAKQNRRVSVVFSCTSNP